MSTLHIERIERFSPFEWAIRFRGPRTDFLALVDDFRYEKRAYVRWEQSTFDGRGAWVVDEGTLLMSYSDRFDNLRQRIEHIMERERAQEIARLNRIVDEVLQEYEQEKKERQ